jgi:hypothetical protein
MKESKSIMKLLSRAVTFAICLSLAPSIAIAQQRIHALSGTVRAIHPKIQMTEIDTDDGSSGHFEWLTKTGVSIDFDKAVSADAIAADKFTTRDTHVIVYYCGVGDVRTIVALHDLGTGPLLNSTGTVVRLSRHEHLLVLRNSTGGDEIFQLDAKTVADTENGVMTGFKFDYNKGVHVRVIATQANGNETALLIVPIF